MPDPLDAPLAVAWEQHLTVGARPMVIPGHKGSTDLVGPVVGGDVPLFAGVASMRGAPEALGRAEAAAAALWGADWCRFSVAGSTHGNQAMALAVGKPGDVVIATRAVHRSLLLGFVLAGLNPVWVQPEVDLVSGLPGGIPVERLEAALAAHPEARAVFVVEPGYVGARSDVAGLARTAHAVGVPLVVDQAWGAHLGFHPDLPPHALTCGADAFVTSAHKALPAYTQSALVLARTERLDRDRLERAFEATHTTSPSGTIIASIDAARALLARDGERLLGRTIAARRCGKGQAARRLRPCGPRRATGPVRPHPPGRGARRDRRAGPRGRGRPGRARVRRGDGRPRHDRGDGDHGGHRRDGGAVRRRAHRGHRTPPGRTAGRAPACLARRGQHPRGGAQSAGRVLRSARDGRG